MILSPTNNLAVFNSCWALYELYVSCTEHECDFEVAMTKSDSDEFIDPDLDEPPIVLHYSNKSVDILKAGAYHSRDKERILELIEKEVVDKYEGEKLQPRYSE